MNSIFGGLIEFDNKEEFENYINSLDRKSAIQIIEKQVEYIVMNGGFTLTENHALYKCLEILKENENHD